MGGHVVQAGRMWQSSKFAGAGVTVLFILLSLSGMAIAAVSPGASSKQEKALAQSTTNASGKSTSLVIVSADTNSRGSSTTDAVIDKISIESSTIITNAASIGPQSWEMEYAGCLGDQCCPEDPQRRLSPDAPSI